MLGSDYNNFVKPLSEDRSITQGHEVDVSQFWPYLSSLGSEGFYNYEIQISHNTISLKMYEGARIFSHGGLFHSKSAYRYYGNILLITDGIIRTAGCLMADRHLPLMERESAIKNQKLCGYQLWSLRHEFPVFERERIEEIVKWLENGLCLTQTYSYAIYFCVNTFAVVFRRPELQVEEYLVQQLSEAAESYRKTFY